MRRFFISAHPTFGSYKQPTPYRVEASPYFWWWYALTLNEEYLAFAAADGDLPCLETSSADETAAISRVFRDFGNVKYDGCRYFAFCNWWRERVDSGEERGAYLFAEPLLDESTRQIERLEDAASALGLDGTILIAIPLDSKRKYIDNAIDRILHRNVTFAKGRSARNPKTSQARYQMSKPAQPQTLKLAFDLYDARTQATKAGEKVSNVGLAKAAGLIYREREKEDEAAYNEAERARVISMLVSRHLANVRQMISNSAIGRFPF